MRYLRSTILAAGLLFLAASTQLTAEDKKGTLRPNNVALVEMKTFDINTLRAATSSDGFIHGGSGWSAVEWPRGSGKTCVYNSGLWIFGLHKPSGRIRGATSTSFASEFQPGPILHTFNTSTNDGSVAANAADRKYRLFKFQRSDAARPAGTNSDYDEWPGNLGAPYVDVNGDGRWERDTDVPEILGDQQLWSVCNDADASRHLGNYSNSGTAPMGFELRSTYYGFNRPGALGNVEFVHLLLINKSDAQYDSVLVGIYSDPDMGFAGDDLIGVDTTLDLVYAYGGAAIDRVYGPEPPACGFMILRGPAVPSAQGDTAVVNGKTIHGARNVRAFASGAFTWDGMTETPFSEIIGLDDLAQRMYTALSGWDGIHYLPYSDPTTGRTSRFVFPGDPVTGTGWLPSASGMGPGDWKEVISTGPFTFAPGDTQEIDAAFIVAQGSDALNSVTRLRRFAHLAKDAFAVNFDAQSGLCPPQVTASGLDREIVLTWDGPSVEKTESYHSVSTSSDSRFEGYNVYQGATSSGPWTRIATYDVPRDSVGEILDYVQDPTYGLFVRLPVAFGDDSTGIKRYFRTTVDALNGGKALVNGREYYFAVTAYTYNSDSAALADGVPLMMENTIVPVTIVPREQAAGDRLSAYAHRLPNGRPGDDALAVSVVNPRRVTGGSYRVTFNGTGNTVNSWNVVRNGVDTALASCINFTGGQGSPIIDGLMFRVQRFPDGVRRDSQDPQGFTYEPESHAWFTGAGVLGSGGIDRTLEAFNNGLVYPQPGNYEYKGTRVAPDQLKKVQIRFSATQTQKAYRYLSGYNAFPPSPVRDSSFLPYMLRRGNGYVYQDFVDVPFTVWEIDSLDGDPVPRQLSCGFVESNDTLYSPGGDHRFVGKGRVDGRWKPTAGSNGGKEIVYIFASPYTSTPQPQYMRDPLEPADSSKYLDLRARQDSVDVMYVLWAKALDTTAGFTDGDLFTIAPNYPLASDRVFLFSVEAPTAGNSILISEDMARIGVFPNPYLAYNRGRTSAGSGFVTFTNLPTNIDVTIRIYSLSGELLATILHHDATGFARWNLRNDSGLAVASGMYFAHIEVKNAGNRILKLAIIQPQQ